MLDDDLAFRDGCWDFVGHDACVPLLDP